MGANIDTRTYPDSLGKAKVLEQWQQDCEASRYESGHSYSGEIGMLHGTPDWKNKQFSNEREAEDFIAEKHEKWEPPLAVSFKHTDGQLYWLIGGWCSS